MNHMPPKLSGAAEAPAHSASEPAQAISYEVIEIAQQVAPRYEKKVLGDRTQWSTDTKGIKRMNELAAEGWRVVAATAHTVIMESPQ